jgi:arginyl-tRNA synthetase
MNLEITIQGIVKESIKKLYGIDLELHSIQLQKTKREFEGDITVVVFPFVKAARKSPEQTGEEIGKYLQNTHQIISSYNVIKGFLNLSISKEFWLDTLQSIFVNKEFGKSPQSPDAPLMMIEYSSPNTNKPLHLGHIRNNLLGFSLSEIQKANG